LKQLEIKEVSHYLNLEKLYNEPKASYFALLSGNKKEGKNLKQKIFKVSELGYVLRNLNKEKDTYISQGIFFKPNRRAVNLWSIGLNFVDLDIYTIAEITERPVSKIIDEILKHLEEEKIPTPSIVIHSGRGLYLKWYYQKGLPRPAVPRWNAIQKILIEKLKKFGADVKARDVSRVLRVVGTTNTKVNKKVEIIWESGKEYDFEELAKEILPYKRRHKGEYTKKGKNVSSRPYQKRLITGVSLDLYKSAQLWWDRLEDIRKYVKMRWGGRVPEGYRDITLFLSFIALGWINPLNKLIYGLEFEQLIKEYQIGMPRKEIFAYMKTAENRLKRMAEEIKSEGENFKYNPYLHLYRYTTDRIIELLDIKPEYQRQLKTLVSKDIQREKDREYQRERRRKKGARSKEEIKAKKIEMKKQIKELRNKGYSLREIGKNLGISYEYVRRMLEEE